MSNLQELVSGETNSAAMEMDETLDEEEIIKRLFHMCDVHNKGNVGITTLIECLKDALGNGNVCICNCIFAAVKLFSVPPPSNGILTICIQKEFSIVPTVNKVPTSSGNHRKPGKIMQFCEIIRQNHQ